MFLRTSTISMLEKSIGISVSELAAMDRGEELSFIKSKSGRIPTFSKKIDHRIAARGNHALNRKQIMTMDEVNKQILGWKKDERKY